MWLVITGSVVGVLVLVFVLFVGLYDVICGTRRRRAQQESQQQMGDATQQSASSRFVEIAPASPHASSATKVPRLVPEKAAARERAARPGTFATLAQMAAGNRTPGIAAQNPALPAYVPPLVGDEPAAAAPATATASQQEI